MKVQPPPFTIDPTPRDLAEEFCRMSVAEQAAFFDRVAELAAAWERPDVMQWHALGRELRGTSGASVVEKIAEVLDEPIT
jgi:hypothetical protein